MLYYCFCHCKDTNSKAIHNAYRVEQPCQQIVFATAKILIRKQFTTASCSIMWIKDCFCHCKDTNSKAIHNSVLMMAKLPYIVFATAKILIRKQFTTPRVKAVLTSYCFCHCKDTNSKAIHNRVKDLEKNLPLFLPLQRY